MSKTFYFAGQQHFGNRGCEALVRGTATMLNMKYPGVRILCPSLDPELDQAQWPNAADYGIEFVKEPPKPKLLKWWHRLTRLFPIIKRFGLPEYYPVTPELLPGIAQCDAAILIGGDNFTLDYKVSGLVGNTAFSRTLSKKGIPNILWAASVGPFKADPPVEKYMKHFLQALPLVTIREPVSMNYLADLGLKNNVTKVSDPAFYLEPEQFDLAAHLPANANNRKVIGLNFSPLVTKFGKENIQTEEILAEIADFIRSLIARNYCILLVPHVDPLDGSSKNSDSDYMAPLLEILSDQSMYLSMLPRTLNAAQLKYAISQCHIFMGARTHSTIAGFSTYTPTISISYSVKALGLNQDIFGHDHYVLHARTLEKARLESVFDQVENEHDVIKARLKVKVPELRQTAFISVEQLDMLLDSQRQH